MRSGRREGACGCDMLRVEDQSSFHLHIVQRRRGGGEWEGRELTIFHHAVSSEPNAMSENAVHFIL